MEGLPLKQILEGAILASESPLSMDQLMQLFETDPPERNDVRDVLKEIEEDFSERGFELKQVASGYRFQVRSDYGQWVARLWKEKPPRYSRALLETLALVAYKQPITRGDIEEIRGVAVSTNIMRTLIEREWVRVVGHRDVPGHPALYATTKNFLDYFNLKSLDELPSLSEIKDLAKVNEDLNLDEDLIEVPRMIELDESDQAEVAGVDDADLDAVSDQVNAIQENIKNLFEPEPVDEALERELSGENDDPVDGAVSAPEPDSQSEAASEQQDQGETGHSGAEEDAAEAAQLTLDDMVDSVASMDSALSESAGDEPTAVPEADAAPDSSDGTDQGDAAAEDGNEDESRR